VTRLSVAQPELFFPVLRALRIAVLLGKVVPDKPQVDVKPVLTIAARAIQGTVLRGAVIKVIALDNSEEARRQLTAARERHPHRDGIDVQPVMGRATGHAIRALGDLPLPDRLPQRGRDDPGRLLAGAGLVRPRAIPCLGSRQLLGLVSLGLTCRLSQGDLRIVGRAPDRPP
jgi:hypothetical protein